MRLSGIIIIFWSVTCSTYGQIGVSQHVIASGGADAKSAKIGVSSTLGETIIFGGNKDNYFHCQGFQSGNEGVISAVFNTELAQFDLRYFPNPSHDFLQVNWKQSLTITQMTLLDEKGAQALNVDISDQQTNATLDLRSLVSGKYILQFNDQSNHTFAAGWILFTR